MIKIPDETIFGIDESSNAISFGYVRKIKNDIVLIKLLISTISAILPIACCAFKYCVSSLMEISGGISVIMWGNSLDILALTLSTILTPIGKSSCNIFVFESGFLILQ